MKPRRILALVLTASLVAAACGSRRTHDELVEGARGAGSARVGTAGPGAAQATGPGAANGTSSSTGGSVVGGGDTGAGATGGPGDTAASTPGGGGQVGGQGGGSANAGPGSPVRIGVVGTLSGFAGESLAPLADGVRVWSRFINDHGGVNGHKVEVITADDGGDPSRHRSLVQEFVEQRGVTAFLAMPEALTGAGSVDYLTSVGVPVIGSEGAEYYFYQSPVYFPQGSTGPALLQSLPPVVAAVAKPRGLTKVATISCVEVQICRDGDAKARAGFAKVGLQVVYQAQSTLAKPDFTAECLNAHGKGAQIVVVAMDATAIRSIAQSCARQGFHPLYVYSAAQATASQPADPNLAGSLIVTNVGAWPSTSTPLTQEFNDAWATYAPGTVPLGGHMQGWVAGKIFELAAQQLPEPPTAKAVLDALGQISGDVLPDLTGPLLFHPGQPATPTVCGFAVFIDGGAFVAGDSIGRMCTDFDPAA